MKSILTTLLLGGAICAPVAAQPPAHAPAHGYRAKFEDDLYAPRYRDRYADREFAYFSEACESRDEAALGALLGGLIGRERLGGQLGATLSDCDRNQFALATRQAVENDEPYYFRNPDTGLRAVVRPEDRFERRGRVCRRARAEFFSPDGTFEEDTVTVCRSGDGWEIEG